MTARNATIVHVDMDAFFVSVELLDQPELRGRPVVVGGSGDRGVVAAASYEARAHGVRSAMPASQARRLCPEAIFLKGRHGRYSEVSEQVMSIFRDVTPLVEPLSLDEAFLDVTGARRLLGDGPTIGAALRARVLDELGLTCSVGVAPTKFVAKLASEAAKPKASPSGPVFGTGVHVVEVDGVLDFLRPLPVEALWGVGPATLTKMHRLGIVTIADLADLPEENVVAALGRSHGRHLHALANGIDEREVVPDRGIKSIGHEETFPRDVHSRAVLDRELVGFADAVASRLRGQSLVGRTVQIKVRFGDFTTITRSSTVDVPIDDAPSIVAVAKSLLDQVDPAPGVRLLGLSVAGLGTDEGRQLTLDDALGAADWQGASRTVDEIRARFGDTSIGPATATGPDGLRLKRRGQQQWGPDAATEGNVGPR